MGLIKGSVSCTRFNTVSLPETLDFDQVAYHPISPGSTLREREGFVPFEPGESYEIGARRWAFRVRIDKIQLDATSVNERLKELIKHETETVGPPSPKTRQKLKQLAEDELMAHPMPRSRIIECVLEETTLYVGATARAHLGLVLELLKRVGVEVDFKTPWLDAGQEEETSPFIELKEPGQSLWGCRFLKKILNDPDIFVEPEKGSVKILTPEGVRVSLAGPVLNELDRFLETEAEVVAARLMMDDYQFGFDGLSYRINGLKMERPPALHWTEQLDARLDRVKDLWTALDQKYQALFNA